MKKEGAECWGTTFIDSKANFSETEPQEWAVKYCYFEPKSDSCSTSKDGIYVVINEKTTRSDIRNLATIVNEMRSNKNQQKCGINYGVLEQLNEQLNGSEILVKKEYELYRKKRD